MQTRGQKRIISMILAIGLVCVTMVVLSAYAAELRVDNNRLIASNQALQDDIDTLSIKIKTTNNIEHIENVATTQLGMVYASDSECIYLSEADSPVGNLAMIIREGAYN